LPEPAAATWLSPSREEPSIETTIADQIRRWCQAKLASGDPGGDLYQQLLQLVEPPLLQAAMERHGQCVAAARDLGLHRTTLRKKLDQYGFDDK